MSRPISELLVALKAGEPVEDKVYEHFYRLAWNSAKERIDRSIQSVVDPSDIANAAMRSALSALAHGRMRGYGSDEFRHLLTHIVKTKVIDQARRALAEKRSAHRSSDADVGELADPRGLSPVEIAALNEEALNQEMDKVISNLLPLDDPIDEAIAYLSFIQDYTPQQISDWMNENQERTHGKTIKVRAIQLRLTRIHDRLKVIYSEYGPEP
jgi:DNA-directed RNA polymerase specialized sigma24 family protein